MDCTPVEGDVIVCRSSSAVVIQKSRCMLWHNSSSLIPSPIKRTRFPVACRLCGRTLTSQRWCELRSAQRSRRIELMKCKGRRLVICDLFLGFAYARSQMDWALNELFANYDFPCCGDFHTLSPCGFRRRKALSLGAVGARRRNWRRKTKTARRRKRENSEIILHEIAPHKLTPWQGWGSCV